MERKLDMSKSDKDYNGVIHQSHAAFDVATSRALDVDAYIVEAKQLKSDGFYDIETYRVRGASSRPAS